MVQLNQKVNLDLGGNQEQQSLARQIWDLMRMQGYTAASSSPIRQTLDRLAEYLASQKYAGLDTAEAIAPLVDQALTASPAVFLREETDDGEVSFKTTKRGVAPPRTPVPLDHHSSKTRLNEEARLIELMTEEERAQLTASEARPDTAVFAPPLPFAAPPEAAKAAATPPPVTPTARVVEAALASSAPLPTQAKPATVPPVAPKETRVEPPTVKPAATVAPAPVVKEPEPVAAPEPAPAVVAPEPVAVAEPVAGAEATLADGLVVDLNLPTDQIIERYGSYFKEVVQPALADDLRLVNFSQDWYLDDLTDRFSKNEMRRIRDYIMESQLPVSDTVLLDDLFGKQPENRDYAALRFALNYRLLKEKRDFEFVGADDDRVWSVPTLPPIGNTVRKASEVGVEYKFLEDAHLVDPSEVVIENGRKVWYHTLTYYEYENGLLPYNASAKEMFPGPLLEDQKTLILRLEATQLYETYTAELRFPTGSRGGWIAGLETFFSNNLIPGAVLIIREGERSNHFDIEYQQGEEQESRLLFYDERRQKFVFRTIGYTCQVDPGMLMSPERCSRLDGQKRLDEAERKRTDHVVGKAFELGGERTTEGYYAHLDDLYPIVNIERPFSRAYLRSLLTGGNTAFRADATVPNAFTYKPIGQRR